MHASLYVSKDTAQMRSWPSFPKPSNKRMGREKPVGEDIAKGVEENQENGIQEGQANDTRVF